MAQVYARKKLRRPIAEINVVPYIDVMLVLLVIFMVTAPLLNLGVDVKLPQADAKPLQSKADPVLVNVDAKGDYYLTLEGTAQLLDADGLAKQLAAIVKNNPEVAVLVGGDEAVAYGRVYEVLALLQAAGISRVSLVGEGKAPRAG